MELIPDAISGLIRISGGRTGVFMPPTLDTEEKCFKAIRMDSGYLEFVPEELKTADLCLEAVKQSGVALAFVPRDLRTAEFCIAAIRQDRKALRWVPRKLKTRKSRRTYRSTVCRRNTGRRNFALRPCVGTASHLGTFRMNTKPRICALPQWNGAVSRSRSFREN